ncbi:hypothetical protein V5O48_016804 [Marasmius crinis-equi]|uniref:Uncharacterized protein n=1 Tax=Marasmius crinis-equi TaxID=585013 RepID=A0ABR3EQP6_9AGAR
MPPPTWDLEEAFKAIQLVTVIANAPRKFACEPKIHGEIIPIENLRYQDSTKPAYAIAIDESPRRKHQEKNGIWRMHDGMEKFNLSNRGSLQGAFESVQDARLAWDSLCHQYHGRLYDETHRAGRDAALQKVQEKAKEVKARLITRELALLYPHLFNAQSLNNNLPELDGNENFLYSALLREELLPVETEPLAINAEFAFRDAGNVNIGAWSLYVVSDRRIYRTGSLRDAYFTAREETQFGKVGIFLTPFSSLASQAFLGLSGEAEFLKQPRVKDWDSDYSASSGTRAITPDLASEPGATQEGPPEWTGRGGTGYISASAYNARGGGSHSA